MFGRVLRKNGKPILDDCRVARSFVPRLVGLMFRTGIGDQQGILFPRCESVHTFFMRFAIDVVFLDRAGNVLAVREGVKPWRMLLPIRGGKHILELGSGRAKALGIRKGDTLEPEGGLS